MVLKVYLTICTILAMAAAAMFVSGNFTTMVSVVFGFIAFGMVFMGMMFVLPFTATHTSIAAAKAKPASEPVPSYAGARVASVSASLTRQTS